MDTAVQDKTLIGKKRRVRKINRILGETYPYAVAELDFENPFELLVATVLSAQTTDVRVNAITPQLFARYPDAHAMAAADEAELSEFIRPTGFYQAKTRSLLGLSNALVEAHDGEVPDDLDELVKLPGVGRKTAFVVLGNAFGKPGLTVDTHFGRLARRLGMAEETDPVKVEREVAELFEPKDWTDLSHRLIYHGRRTCHSRKPACGACPVAHLCPSYGIGETDAEAASQLLKYELAPGRQELHQKFLAGYTRRQLQAEGYPLHA
nr:endonuclease III [Nesterenkonia ebinurensis]